MQPYEVVDALEKAVAAYGGSKYAVAVDSCSNALLLASRYRFMTGSPTTVSIPKRTYVGVAQAILNAGGQLKFRDEMWHGAYELQGIDVIDSARRFTRGMYIPGTLYCLSAHWSKTLKIGRGGFILTDDMEAASILKRMRFDGRQSGVRPVDDNFILGIHAYMLPEEASRGLMLMSFMPNINPDIPWDDYADLSLCEAFKAKI